MNSRRFRKIRITERGYTIVYDKENEEHYWEQHSLTATEYARPEFEDAMKRLAPIFVYMCQLAIDPKNIGRNVSIEEVSYAYPKKKPSYLQVKGTAFLPNGREITLASPAWDIPTIHDGITNGMDFFQLLSNLEEEAWKYVDGERAQQKLDFSPKSDDVENPMLEEDGQNE